MYVKYNIVFQFIPWKKKYYRIKLSPLKNDYPVFGEIVKIMREKQMFHRNTYLSGLIRSQFS